jgi:hypothetical protein
VDVVFSIFMTLRRTKISAKWWLAIFTSGAIRWRLAST